MTSTRRSTRSGTRVVALKLLPPLFSGSAEFQERFRRESRVAARLRDPHIIPIHDFGEIDSRLYIDMRLVDSGRTVATLLREEGALPPERAVHLVGQIAEALDAAHGDGLIHRDVKPSERADHRPRLRLRHGLRHRALRGPRRRSV